MTDTEVWQLVLKHEKALRRALTRYVSKAIPRNLREQVLQEIWDEVVIDRAVSIMRTYDPQHASGASPATHLFRNVQWYALKWGRKRITNSQRRQEFTIRQFEQAKDEGEPVYNILDGLEDRAAKIVEWAAVQGFTFVEIADYLKTTPAKVRDEYHAAKLQLMETMRDDAALL